MYSKNCNAELVNDARKLMFFHSLRSLDSIPPNKNALFQHIKRALLVAAFIWKQSLSKTPEIPKPSEWGWEWNTRTKEWVPYWTDLSDVSQACSLLLHCGSVVLPVRETVTATELDSDVAVCASARDVAQVMTKKAELIMAMMCAEYYGADIKLIKLIIFTYYILGPLVQIYCNKSKPLLP